MHMTCTLPVTESAHSWNLLLSSAKTSIRSDVPLLLDTQIQDRFLKCASFRYTTSPERAGLVRPGGAVQLVRI